MAQLLCDSPEIYSIHEQPGGVAVPEVVKTDMRQPRFLQDPLEPAVSIGAPNCVPFFGAKLEAAINFIAPSFLLISIFQAPTPHRVGAEFGYGAGSFSS